MKKSILISLSVAVAITLWMLSGLIPDTTVTDSGLPDEQAADKSAPPFKVQVKTFQAENVTREITILGQVEPSRQVLIPAETAGTVKKLLVKQGDAVQAGQLLLELSMDQRLSNLSEAKALHLQRSADYQAAERLQARGLQADTQLALALAQLESAKAMLERAQLEIDNTGILAPFAGVINEKYVELGSFVDRGDPAFLLLDNRRLLASGQVPQQNVHLTKAGGKARVKFLNGKIVNGVISYISATGDAATRSFRIEVEIPNAEDDLVAGVSSEIIVPVATVPGHLLSPALLSLSDTGVLGVKTVDQDNRVRFFPVDIIRTNAQGAWVSGLPQRVTIITLGQGFVNPDEPVTPVSEEARES